MLDRLIGFSAMAVPVPFSVSRDRTGDRVERGHLVDREDGHNDGHRDRIEVAVAAGARVHQSEVDRARSAIVGLEREGEEACAVDARGAIVGDRDVRDQLPRVRDITAVGCREGEVQGHLRIGVAVADAGEDEGQGPGVLEDRDGSCNRDSRRRGVARAAADVDGSDHTAGQDGGGRRAGAASASEQDHGRARIAGTPVRDVERAAHRVAGEGRRGRRGVERHGDRYGRRRAVARADRVERRRGRRRRVAGTTGRGDRHVRDRGIAIAGIGDGDPGDQPVGVHHGGCRRLHGVGAGGGVDRDQRWTAARIARAAVGDGDRSDPGERDPGDHAAGHDHGSRSRGW